MNLVQLDVNQLINQLVAFGKMSTDAEGPSEPGRPPHAENPIQEVERWLEADNLPAEQHYFLQAVKALCDGTDDPSTKPLPPEEGGAQPKK